MGIMELCHPGEWPQQLQPPKGSSGSSITPVLNLICSPCPIGMQCVDGLSPPAPCSKGTASIAPGAARCCPRDTACPSGTSVSTDCTCIAIACETPLVLVRIGRDLQCAPDTAVVSGSGAVCARCKNEGYVIENGCACVRVNDCRSSTATTSSWWRTAQQRFVCMSLFL